MADTTTDAVDLPLDPGFLASRREALVIFLAWVICLAWAVPACYLFGYGSPAPVRTLLGIPAWVVWGIVVPWLAADAFTLWVCLHYMGDDPTPEQDEAVAEAGR